MSDAELVRYWLQYADRQWELKNAEAGINEDEKLNTAKDD